MLLLLALILAQETPAQSFKRIEEALASANAATLRFEGAGENRIAEAASRFTSRGELRLGTGNQVRLQLDISAAGQSIESLLICDGVKLWFRSGTGKPQVQAVPRLLRANLCGLLLRVDLGSAFLMGLGDVDLVKLMPVSGVAEGPDGRNSLAYQVGVPDLAAKVENVLWLDPKTGLPVKHRASLTNGTAVNAATETFTRFELGGAADPSSFTVPAEAQDAAKPAIPELQVGGDPDKRYFLMGAGGEAPKDGYRLVVVLPGGDGSPSFQPFVQRIRDQALGDGTLVVQLVAKEWTPGQFNRIVWPTAKSQVDGMKFTTEEFVDAAIVEVSGKHKVDPRRVFTLSWSSGGPAAYAVSLAPNTRVKGSFIAMSVFHPATLPPLGAAKGRGYYLLHSPDDKVCPMALAEQAIAALRENGASAELATYPGGHGWRGAVFDQIRAGFDWLGNR